MKAFIVICSLLIATCANAAEPTILELRNLFYRAEKDKAASEALCRKLEATANNGSTLMMAYKGIGLIMSAKHAFNPYTKLSNFSSGKSLLEQAVGRDAADPEIRFLRYCIQTQVPGVLRYHANKDEDKTLLLSRWKAITDEDLKGRIKVYLLQFGNCTRDEKMKLQ